MDVMQRKICLLGDFAVGKTSLVRRFVYNKFEADYLATIGVHVSRKEVKVGLDPARRVALVIWDLAGGETFSHMEEAYYRGSAGALLVADVTRPDTFGMLNTYATTFMRINPNAALVFAFNKVDLQPDNSAYAAAAEELATRWQAPYYLTSALTGESVEDAFKTLAASLLGN
ncbi:MAG: GTP-binding protein [Caldilineae bacterium]|nr:MAG: GTP-binding protein [Caldilineae bacterium]